MPGRYRLLPIGIEGQYFKPALDGWLFGAPRPWLSFGRRPAYLVTDAQKEALAARIRMSRYARLVLGLPLAATAPLWIHLVRGLSPVGNTLLVFYLYLTAVHFLEYVMIRDVLAGLPRASEQMTVADMLRQQSVAMSVRTQVVLGAFFGLVCACCLASLLLGVSDQGAFLRYIAAFSGGLSVLWLGMLATTWWRKPRPDGA